LALLTFITCVTNAAFCILFPFYPQEAAVRLGIENLDKTPTGDIGFVLSASSLAYFAFALVSGQWIDSVGVKPVLLWGLSALCLATLLFGSLILVKDYALFIWMSFVISILQGLAGAAEETACFALACREFPDSVGMAVGMLEQGVGLGMMLASPVGGALYSYGGFSLPFTALGLTLVACAIFSMCLINNDSEDEVRTSSKPPISVLTLVRNFQISLSASCGISSAALLGFLDASLATYLDQKFELTPLKIGMVFVLSRGLYAFLAPIVGKVADECGAQQILAIGLLLCWSGFFLMVFTTDFWIFVVSQAIIGLGIAMASVPCFADILTIAGSHGQRDSVSVSGVISGMLAASFALGEGLGSLMGGKLVESLGFTGAGLVCSLVMFFHWISYITLGICFRPKDTSMDDVKSKWEVINHFDI
jgi:MFS family permease